MTLVNNEKREKSEVTCGSFPLSCVFSYANIKPRPLLEQRKYVCRTITPKTKKSLRCFCLEDPPQRVRTSNVPPHFDLSRTTYIVLSKKGRQIFVDVFVSCVVSDTKSHLRKHRYCPDYSNSWSKLREGKSWLGLSGGLPSLGEQSK